MKTLIGTLLVAALLPMALAIGEASAQSAAALRSRSFTGIDRHVLGTPPSRARSVNGLAAYLTRPASGDVEKARAIYRWITHNVSYNAEAYFSGRFRNAAASAEGVLKSRQAVCDGYSKLFQALAGAAGLESRRVVGFAKGAGYTLGQSIDGQSNHAWNAVRIDGNWYLVDTTWGAGYVNTERRTFTRRFEKSYFLTPPEQFIARHYPEDPQWQLLPNPLSEEKFERAVMRTPRFFSAGLELDSHKEGSIKAESEVRVRLRTPARTLLLARVLRDDKTLERSLATVEPGKGFATVHARFPRAGDYTLRIMSKEAGSKGPYSWAADYRVQAKKGTRRRYPRYGDGFFEHNWRLVSHKDGNLTSRGRLRITVSVPESVGVIGHLEESGRILQSSPVLVQQEQEQVTIDAAFPKAGNYRLVLFSKPNSQSGSFGFALSYQIRASAGARGGLPLAYGGFREHRARVHAPMSGELKPGQSERFDLSVPRAEKVAVVIGSQWTQLTRKGSRFTGSVAIERGDITVYARFPGGSNYTGLLRYRGK